MGVIACSKAVPDQGANFRPSTGAQHHTTMSLLQGKIEVRVFSVIFSLKIKDLGETLSQINK